MRLFNVPVLAVFCALVGFGCSEKPCPAGNLLDTLQCLKLTMAVSYLEKFNLDADLNKTNAATVFAPTNDAFANFFANFSVRLTDAELEDVLKGHVVDGNVDAAAAVRRGKLTSLAGSSVLVKSYNFSKPMVVANGGEVKKPDQKATNGVIHVVDKVMYPLVRRNTMDTLAEVAPITAAFIQSTPQVLKLLDMGIPGYTLFAPSDAAWTRVPFEVLKNLTNDTDTQLLLSHLVSPSPVDSDASRSGPLFAAPLLRLAKIRVVGGWVSLNLTNSHGNLLVNNATVEFPDIGTTDDRIIHVIDRVLLETLNPPPF